MPTLHHKSSQWSESIMTGAGHVARVGEGRNIYAYSILVGRPQGKDHLRDIGVNVRIILKWNLRQWDVKVWLELNWFSVGSSQVLLWIWQWTLDSIKSGIFFTSWVSAKVERILCTIELVKGKVVPMSKHHSIKAYKRRGVKMLGLLFQHSVTLKDLVILV